MWMVHQARKEQRQGDRKLRQYYYCLFFFFLFFFVVFMVIYSSGVIISLNYIWDAGRGARALVNVNWAPRTACRPNI